MTMVNTWVMKGHNCMTPYTVVGAHSLTSAHTLELTVKKHSLTSAVSHIPSDKHLLCASAVLVSVWQGLGRTDSPGGAVGQEMLAWTMDPGSLTVTISARHTSRGKKAPKISVAEHIHMYNARHAQPVYLAMRHTSGGYPQTHHCPQCK